MIYKEQEASLLVLLEFFSTWILLRYSLPLSGLFFLITNEIQIMKDANIWHGDSNIHDVYNK